MKMENSGEGSSVAVNTRIRTVQDGFSKRSIDYNIGNDDQVKDHQKKKTTFLLIILMKMKSKEIRN